MPKIRVVRQWLCFVAAVGCLALCTDAFPEVKAVATTVCEVTQHPVKFDRRRLSFDAKVESDGIERTVLVDGQGQCPRGIVPRTDPKSQKSIATMKNVELALSQGHPGTLDNKITAHFLGVLSMGRAEEFAMPHGTTVFVLTVESVEGVKVQSGRASR